MYNPILWTLDNEFDGASFERLCTDLMFREGYKDIIPVGGSHDRGRDAELRTWKGIKSTGGRTFFQYTLEKDWENKLEGELNKVKNNKHEIDFYVFVTIQSVTGNKRDKLREMVAGTYNWQLIIYEREWFRHRLEEAYPDLAAKYLGISAPNELAQHKSELAQPFPERNSSEKAWELYIQGKYEAAIVEFKELLQRDKQNVAGWQALAWCQYSLYRYNEALVSIAHALSFNESDSYSLSMKACILTEDGIQRGIRANLLIARDVFKDLADKSSHSVDHFNYGNVLQELGDYEGAKKEFLIAIDHNPAQAEIWKNLGSVYFHLKDHRSEIDCYDRALALNNQLPEALISKGVTLLNVYGKKQEAAELIERGIGLDESMAIKWPHAWYWLALAHYEQDNLREALKHINSGLSIVPSHYGLLKLKSTILAKLWRKDNQFIEEAVAFFKFRLELSKEDYNSLVELMHLFKVTGQDELAWKSLADFLDLDAVNLSTHFELTGHSIDDLLVSFRYFPAYRTFRKHSKIQDYPKLLENVNISLHDNFEDALFIVYSIPFGLACDIISQLPIDKRVEGIEKIKENILTSFKKSVPQIAAKSIKSIKRDTTGNMADGLATVLLGWPDIALMEFSRQAGYIGSIFGVPLAELDKIIIKQGQNLGQWQIEILNETLYQVNKKLQIFKE